MSYSGLKIRKYTHTPSLSHAFTYISFRMAAIMQSMR